MFAKIKEGQGLRTHLFSKSKFNLKSDRVNLVATASPIECLLYLPNVRAIPYKLGPESTTTAVYVDKYSMVIATNLTSMCCVYKEKIVKNDSHRKALRPEKFRKLQYLSRNSEFLNMYGRRTPRSSV